MASKHATGGGRRLEIWGGGLGVGGGCGGRLGLVGWGLVGWGLLAGGCWGLLAGFWPGRGCWWGGGSQVGAGEWGAPAPPPRKDCSQFFRCPKIPPPLSVSLDFELDLELDFSSISARFQLDFSSILARFQLDFSSIWPKARF